MPTPHFYLKKPEPKRSKNRPDWKKSLVLLQLKFQRQKLVYSFGLKIDPANWNATKGRIKNNKQTIGDGTFGQNGLLEALEKVVTKAYNDNLVGGFPEVKTLKNSLDEYMNKKITNSNIPTLFDLIGKFVSGEIKYKGKDKSENTLRNYRTFQNHLKEYNSKLNYDNINMDFFHKYVAYLKGEKELKHNSIARNITDLKTVMKKAINLKYTNNDIINNDDFTFSEVEVDNVYLTEDQIKTLFRFDLSKTKRLEGMRDLFVFGCYVGLRYSDFSNVQPENIIQSKGESFIKIKTKKTKTEVIIPCDPIVMEIFDRYKESPNKLPKTNARFNELIKDVCKLAGMVDGGLPGKELWECISSHTARRSFATNLYISNFPTLDIMKITGHKTEKAFLKYIKITPEQVAGRLSEHRKSILKLSSQTPKSKSKKLIDA